MPVPNRGLHVTGWGASSPPSQTQIFILGYLDPMYFVGGAMNLNPDLARSALKEKIPSMSVEEAAWAIHERVNEDVAAAFRLHASEAGRRL